MASELRKTGISIVGDLPWGTHFCHFYETKQDLLDTLVPYFKAGLESKEFCVWVVRIAREIHDELGAALSSLRWDLEDVDEGISEPREASKTQELRNKIRP